MRRLIALFLLLLLPLFFYSPSSTATPASPGPVVITSGFVDAEASLRYSLSNKAQGFTVNGAADGVGFPGLCGQQPCDIFADPGDTFTPNASPREFRNLSATVEGVKYPDLSLGPGTNFKITAGTLTLPPIDPAWEREPGQAAFVAFTVPFTFNANFVFHPCHLYQEICDPLFAVPISGQGIATLHFVVTFQQANPAYFFSRVTYEFQSSASRSIDRTGNGEQKFALNVTEHGNLRYLESPAYFRQIATGEGYALCSAGSTSAFDNGETDSGWSAPVITKPIDEMTLPLDLTRATSDGKLELKQRFEWDANAREVSVTMTVKNLSGATVTGVKLSRYFDGDMDAIIRSTGLLRFQGLTSDYSADNDRYAMTSDSVWGWDDGAGAKHHGLMLTALSTGYPHTLAVEKFSDWNPTGSGAQTARSCSSISQAAPTAPGDYVGRLTYNLGTIGAGASKTVKLQYKRF